jgi:mono/diheme cytochrome c family protein
MDMQDQPKLEAYEKGSIRQPVEGTVARGQLKEDKHLYTGKKEQSGQTPATPAAPTASPQTGPGGVPALATYPDAVDTFPFPITEQIVNRGKERYEIFCAMCHGPTGYGDGMIVRRGFRRPPSYHTDQLKQAPVGHFFDVISNGWGSMPAYKAQIPVADRWAIVAYVRALQLSQNPQGAEASSQPAAAQTQPSQPQNAEAGGHR